jgi:hypothetical protein
VKGCTRLNPEKLSYCSEIEDGPYMDKANGCLNLDCGQVSMFIKIFSSFLIVGQSMLVLGLASLFELECFSLASLVTYLQMSFGHICKYFDS